MNDTHVTKGKIGRLIAKNLIVMLVAVIVALTGVLAWFINKSTAEANGISVECQAPDGLYIAVVAPGKTPKDSDYSSSVTLKDQAFLKNLILSEVTSDGIDFYKPPLKQVDGVAQPDDDEKTVWSKAAVNENYLSFDLYVRSEHSNDVYLTANSRFSTATPDDELTGENAGNKSTYGNFSRDFVVGATRLSIVENVENEDTRQLLWIPRPDIYFQTTEGQSIISTGVPSTLYDGVTYKHSYFAVNYDNYETGVKSQKIMADDDVVKSTQNAEGIYTLGDKYKITTITSKDESGFYTKKVTVNIWVEGEDTEARLALVNGKFKVNLDLSI